MQEKALALLQGLKKTKDLGIKEVIVIGDSHTIIKTMVEKSVPTDFRVARVVARIKTLAKSFQRIKFFHVLRENNKDADSEANKVVHLPAGSLSRDRIKDWDPIP